MTWIWSSHGLGWVVTDFLFFEGCLVLNFCAKINARILQNILHIFFALLQQNLTTILMVLCSFPRVTSCRFNTKALLIPTATAWVWVGSK